MKSRFEDAKRAWNQKESPVILRRRKQNGRNQRLRIRLPAQGNHFILLKGSNKFNHKPIYVEKGSFWEVPYQRLNDLVEVLAKFYGKVILMQPVKEKQVCARKCMEASGFECECSCLGANHGSENMTSSWYEVDDTYAVRYGSDQVSLKLIFNK
jgi:hypothetical protein